MSWPKVSEHFGLREEPFRLNFDLRFYFNGRTPSEALANLISGVRTGVRTQVLIGEPGTGKSMLLRKAAEMLRGFGCLAVVESNPLSATVDGMLNAIGDQAGIDCKGIADSEQKLAAILDALRDQSEAVRAILLVDEAQAFPIALKTDLLRFSRPELEGRTLQLVFAGLPKLEAELAQPSLRQLMPALTESYRLAPLSASEVEEYVVHRLRAAGAEHPEALMRDAMKQIAKHSGGVPSRINSLCANALLISYLEGARSVSAETVSKIAREGLPQRLEQTQSERHVTTADSAVNNDGATQTRPLFAVAAEEDAVQPEQAASREQERIVLTPPTASVPVKGRKRPVIITGIVAGTIIGGGMALWWVPQMKLGESLTEPVASPTSPEEVASSRREPEGAVAKVETTSTASRGEPSPALPDSRSQQRAAKEAATPPSAVVSEQTPEVAAGIATVPGKPIAGEPEQIPIVEETSATRATMTEPADSEVAPDLPPTGVTTTESEELVLESLMARGNALLANGDLAAARLFFELAAKKGLAVAPTGVGKTYDPVFYASARVEGTQPKPALARQWYQKASEAGDEEGTKRLADLNAWLERAAFRGDEEARRLLEPR
jgi:MSHA biogenesis protein MshM